SMELEGARTGEATFALDLAEDFGSRKNEPKGLRFGREIVGWIVVIAFVLCELDEQAGFFFGFCDGCLALRLQCLKLGHVFFDGAADALFVGGEELEILGLCDPGAALSESGVDFGAALGSECS